MVHRGSRASRSGGSRGSRIKHRPRILEQAPRIRARAELAVGDVVRLRSGGPKMTVMVADGVAELDTVQVIYADALDALHTEVIRFELLERVWVGIPP